MPPRPVSKTPTGGRRALSGPPSKPPWSGPVRTGGLHVRGGSRWRSRHLPAARGATGVGETTRHHPAHFMERAGAEGKGDTRTPTPPPAQAGLGHRAKDPTYLRPSFSEAHSSSD